VLVFFHGIKLERIVQAVLSLPKECGVDRLQGAEKSSAGFCRQDGQLRVAYVGPHFGEEPPLTGTHGSGTVFFTGCSLRCSYCQNFQFQGRASAKP